MLEGMLVLWLVLTILSLIFVIYDLIVVTPEAGIMKVAWVLVVIYTGPIGLFIYLLSCREPMPSTHEAFIKPMWKQATGSEVHCLAGDATGIIAAAIILSFYSLSTWPEIFFEYLAGFAFGFFIFQSLFMRKMMGGSYFKALITTFFPEWLSMNLIMAGMIPVMVLWDHHDILARDPASLHFWGKMALATIVGGLAAYPMNYWLVTNGLKHGMMTVRKGKKHAHMHEHKEHKSMKHDKKASNGAVFLATIISLICLAFGVVIAAVGSRA